MTLSDDFKDPDDIVIDPREVNAIVENAMASVKAEEDKVKLREVSVEGVC